MSQLQHFKKVKVEAGMPRNPKFWCLCNGVSSSRWAQNMRSRNLQLQGDVT